MEKITIGAFWSEILMLCQIDGLPVSLRGKIEDNVLTLDTSEPRMVSNIDVQTVELTACAWGRMKDEKIMILFNFENATFKQETDQIIIENFSYTTAPIKTKIKKAS